MLEDIDPKDLAGMVARLHQVEQTIENNKTYEPTPEEIGKQLAPRSSGLMGRVMALRGKTAASKSEERQKYEQARADAVADRETRLTFLAEALRERIAAANRATNKKLTELEDTFFAAANDDERKHDDPIFGKLAEWIHHLPGYPRPFDMVSYDASSGAGSLVTGDAELHKRTTTTYITPSPLTFTVGAGQQYVWLDVNLPASTAVLAVGSSKPTSTVTHPKKLLWEFYDKIPIKCWHRGNWDIDQELPDATVLYKVLCVREYDENGTIVAIGSESYPSLATGHTLAWTEDYVRAMTI